MGFSCALRHSPPERAHPPPAPGAGVTFLGLRHRRGKFTAALARCRRMTWDPVSAQVLLWGSDCLGRQAAVDRRPMTHERELLEPVDLCTPDGSALNPDARGWSRRPLHRANLLGQFGRNKRWDYWAILAGDVVISAVV